MSNHIALVTAREALPLDEDMPPLVDAFRAAGATVETPCWDDPSVDWSRFDAAVLRSTWDYMDRLGEFLGWIERCDAVAPVFNAPAVVRWSLDKHYLLDLHRAGVPVVPTRFVEPGEAPAEALAAFLRGGAGGLSAGQPEDFEEFVIKPAIGAGSRDALRLSRGETDRATDHLGRLLEAGRSALLQPYLRRVDEQGETAMVYLGGQFSHAVCKAALLERDGRLVAGLFAPEKITARVPGQDEREVAARACAVVERWDPLYVRVDLVRDAAGQPVVLELEMAEPSLFFAFATGSAPAFARALLWRLRHAADAGAAGSPVARRAPGT